MACSVVLVGSVVNEGVSEREGIVVHRAVGHLVLNVCIRGVRTNLQPRLDIRLGVDTSVILVLLGAFNNSVKAAVAKTDVNAGVVRPLREAYAVVVLDTGLGHLVKPVVALSAAVACELLVGEHCVRTHDYVVPVCLLLSFSSVGIVVGITCSVCIGTQLEELLSVHRSGAVTHGREAYPSVVAYGTFALAALLRRNDDYTVGTARTVQSSSRSVLQHFDRLYVVYVD